MTIEPSDSYLTIMSISLQLCVLRPRVTDAPLWPNSARSEGVRASVNWFLLRAAECPLNRRRGCGFESHRHAPAVLGRAKQSFNRTLLQFIGCQNFRIGV